MSVSPNSEKQSGVFIFSVVAPALDGYLEILRSNVTVEELEGVASLLLRVVIMDRRVSPVEFLQGTMPAVLTSYAAYAYWSANTVLLDCASSGTLLVDLTERETLRVEQVPLVGKVGADPTTPWETDLQSAAVADLLLPDNNKAVPQTPFTTALLTLLRT